MLAPLHEPHQNENENRTYCDRRCTTTAARPPVKLGLFLLAGQLPGMTEGAALASAVDAALAAERAGLAGVWIAEHHFISCGVCPSAVAFAGNLLGRTGRITVGTAVCMVSNRHPVALVEETALLDPPLRRALPARRR
jgi:hypothetical protein